jgi:hypothetical protein
MRYAQAYARKFMKFSEKGAPDVIRGSCSNNKLKRKPIQRKIISL